MIPYPIDQLRERLESEGYDSDVARCDSASSAVEFALRYCTAVAVGLLPEEGELGELRYRAEFELLRSSSNGDWSGWLRDVAAGPGFPAISEFAGRLGYPEGVSELTQKVAEGWQMSCLRTLQDAILVLGGSVSDGRPPTKASALDVFEHFVIVRNLLAHNAPTAAAKGQVGTRVNLVFEELRANLTLLRIPAFLARATPGASASSVVPITPDHDEHARQRLAKVHSAERLVDGYFLIGGATVSPIALLHPETAHRRLLVANGQWNITEASGDFLDYLTGSRTRVQRDFWRNPPSKVLQSQTAGLRVLEARGEAFTNAPPVPEDYIERPELQKDLYRTLEDRRRLILTLKGEGGMGKTSLALRVIDEACRRGLFDLVVWFSARDIDLMEVRATTVKPEVVRLAEMRKLAASLVAELGEYPDGSTDEEWFSNALGLDVSVLWVLDNFETVDDPLGIFDVFDRFVSPPHKLLITTRHREFKGDYPIEVGGMRRNEFFELIDRESVRFGYELSDSDREKIFLASGGHVYVGKVVLAEMVRGVTKSPERLIEAHGDILDALFERTFDHLSPSARDVLLLLGTWRSMVPVVAVDYAIGAYASESDSNVRDTVDELEAFSMVHLVEAEDETWIELPTPVRVFSKGKLAAHTRRSLIDAWAERLKLFAPTKSTSLGVGASRRNLEAFWSAVAGQIENAERWRELRPWIQRLARHDPAALLAFAEELQQKGHLDEAAELIQHYCERAPEDERGFLKLALLREDMGDYQGALEHWIARAQTPNASAKDASFAANKLNGWTSGPSPKVELPGAQKRALAEPLIRELERAMPELSAQDLSRLAWLHVATGALELGCKAAVEGLRREPGNADCENLVTRLKCRS